MKRIGIALVASLVLLAGFASAQTTLHHTTGLVDMGITDFGSLSGGLVEGSLLPNFWYPIGGEQAAAYLGSFSEVWCGDNAGNVASAIDITDDNSLELGEWVSVQPPTFVTDGRIVQKILTRYETSPASGLPFNILIDQESYTWNGQAYPEASGIVLLQFLFTNQSSLDAKGLYFALATDWDIDATDANGQNPNADSTEWFVQGQASVVLDSQEEDGITPVLAALVLIDGSFRAHRILSAMDWDYSDVSRSEAMAPAEFVVDSSANLPGASDYMSVLSVGPYDIDASRSKSATYALVMAQDQPTLIDQIALAHRLALGTTQLRAHAEDRRVIIEWEPAVVQRPHGKTQGHQVLRALSADGPFEALGRGIFGQMSYEDTEVTNGKTYYYRLMALDGLGAPVVAMGQTVISEAVAATPNPRPDAPANLRYRVVHEGLSLDWQEVGAAVEYEVLRSEAVDGAWVRIGTTRQNRFVDTDIASGVPYYYSVVAVAESGQKSIQTDAVMFALEPPEEPSVYEDLEDVTVSPNPLSLASGQVFTFRGLPAQATISIHTASGDLVRKFEHDDGGSKETWGGMADAGEKVAPGIYVYHITAVHSGRGSITKQGLISVIP